MKCVLTTSFLRTRLAVGKSLMISVCVSVLGRTGKHFVNPGVKIDGQYYCDVLMDRDFLQDSSETYTLSISVCELLRGCDLSVIYSTNICCCCC